MTVREMIEALQEQPDDYVIRDENGFEVEYVRPDDAYKEVILEID